MLYQPYYFKTKSRDFLFFLEKKNTNHKYKNKITINFNFSNIFFKTDDSNKNGRESRIQKEDTKRAMLQFTHEEKQSKRQCLSRDQKTNLETKHLQTVKKCRLEFKFCEPGYITRKVNETLGGNLLTYKYK